MKTTHINRVMATVLVIAGLGLAGLSGALAYRSWPAIQNASTQTQVPIPEQLKGQCVTQAKALGFRAQASGHNIRVTMRSDKLSDLKPTFSLASILIPLCKGYELNSFCAGEGCGGNLLFMALRPKY